MLRHLLQHFLLEGVKCHLLIANQHSGSDTVATADYNNVVTILAICSGNTVNSRPWQAIPFATLDCMQQ